MAVARALVTDPRVLFADEPTGALDSLNGERVMQLLTAAARERDAAVVLVTHEARVAAYSDREVVVRDGRTRETVSSMRELLLGARLTLAGGRAGLVRTLITASASGSASPRCCSPRRCRRSTARDRRAAHARDAGPMAPAGPGTVLVGDIPTDVR